MLLALRNGLWQRATFETELLAPTLRGAGVYAGFGSSRLKSNEFKADTAITQAPRCYFASSQDARTQPSQTILQTHRSKALREIERF